MIHQVRTNKKDYWQHAPKVGLLLFALLLCAPLSRSPMLRQSMGMTVARLQDATARALKELGNSHLFARDQVRLYALADATRTSRQASWRTWAGEEVVAARAFQAPTTALPRSPYGDAHWSPFDDTITYTPFVKPTMAYFVGSVYGVTTKGNAQTALNSAVSTDVVEFQSALTWQRGSNPSLAQLIFPPRASGYVLVRDQDTHAVLTQGTRPTPADFAAANTQSVSANDSIWDFAPATQGWYLYGLDLLNASPSNVSNVQILGIVARNTSTGNTAVSIANTARYIIVEQCYIHNPWTSTWTSNCRNGINPSVEYGFISENLIEGIAGNGTENKGINTSQSIGKINVTNNAIEGLTENIMWGGALVQGDLTSVCENVYTARNYIYRRPEWMIFSATEFIYRNHKNFMEHKQGIRHVWERNECVGHSGVGQQQDLQIKHAGQGTSDKGRVTTHDILFRYNRFRDSAAPFAIATSTNANYTPNGTYRIEIAGNLWWDRNPDFVGKTGDRNLMSDIATNVKVVADVYIHHNTYAAQYTTLVFSGSNTSAADSMPNFRFLNNIDHAPTHDYGGVRNNSGTGVTMLNAVCGVGGWQFAGNVGTDVGANLWAGVPGNYRTSVAGLAFVDAANGDYTLVDYSAYPGTDGEAPGVPYAHLNGTMLAGVLTGDPV